MDDSETDDLAQKREVGLGKMKSSNVSIGMLVEVFLHQGAGLDRTDENEITTFVSDDMVSKKGDVIIAGYITDDNVGNFKPPYWFRVKQLSCDSALENNHVNVDYATVHSIINHYGCISRDTTKP